MRSSYYDFLLICTTAITIIKANDLYCPTSDLGELERWTDDLRENARTSDNIAPINGGDGECPVDSSQQKVLMIGIDGLRADAAAMLPLPNFRRLERIGMYSYWANVQSTAVAVSGPGWSSLMTGVEPTKHQVDGNHDLRDIVDHHPTFLKAVVDTFPNKTVAASVKWHPLIDDLIDYQDPATLSGSYKASSDFDMVSKAISWIENDNYDVIFVDFDGCDSAGHSSGFDGYKREYGAAVTQTDKYVGMLLDAVSSRSAGEEWLFVVTSDHGGEGTSHSAYNDYNRRVPFMVASNSPRVDIGRAPYEGSHMDVFPTIMHFFGGDIPEYLDGQVFGFRDYTRTTQPPTPACPNEDPLTCGCRHVQQADYRGTISTTVNGNTCQRWDSQTPNTHNLTPENYPNSGLEENYCRNPDGEDGAWCYTIDGDRWEYCNVPVCGEGSTPTPAAPTPLPTPTKGGECGSDTPNCGCEDVQQADYRGTISTTVNGNTCQRWDSQTPNSHNRTPANYPNSGLEENYCRNPDGEDGAWCYTIDGNRWEYCDVPVCGEGSTLTFAVPTQPSTPTSSEPTPLPTPTEGEACGGSRLLLRILQIVGAETSGKKIIAE